MTGARGSPCGFLGNREDAEEAIQDAFLRAFRALASYEDRERFSAWLSRILINQCRTIRARVQRREEVFSPLELSDAELFVGAETAESVWPDLERALAQLPADQREAVVLRYAGRPYLRRNGSNYRCR
jgi:RNA polymerase sigma-70 factor (ECF subfamily)